MNAVPSPEKKIALVSQQEVSAEDALRQNDKPDTAGKTAAEYTEAMLKYHQLQYHDKQPNKVLKWLGDAALAVLPKSRLYGAAGLVGGLVVGTSVANTAVGYTLAGAKIKEVPSYLKWLRNIGEKVFKGVAPNEVANANRNVRYAHSFIYSLFGGIGAIIGSRIAYSDRVDNNKNPQYLEDYLMSVSHHQGETWGYILGPASLLASSSGAWFWGLLFPGANYGEGLAGYITSMQDRNVIMPYLNDITSGATTTSYLRLKEGSHYLCHYAVGNPAKEPANIEFLAYTILGPLFRDKLTAEHIKQFADAVIAVRSPFWKEGGIPKELRKEALQTMKEVFTGAGLEVLLIDMGLNPASIPFDKVNGLIGKIGDIGQAANIKKDQEAYWAALQSRLPKYVAAGEISQERADWVVAGIEAMRNHSSAPELPSKETFIEPEPSKDFNSLVNSNKGNEIRFDTRELPRNERFAKNPTTGLGKIASSNPIRHLVETAVKNRGDWREMALRERQEMASPDLVHE